MAQQGTINVTTDNIFPIIKQFLYSDQEIFLRELVSNAVDATQKRKMLAQLGEIAEITGTPQVEVLLDEEAGTMTIRDAGIGMTAEEIDKYINQIAFSGATDFWRNTRTPTPSKPSSDTLVWAFTPPSWSPTGWTLSP